jgi:hypothetical protein
VFIDSADYGSFAGRPERAQQELMPQTTSFIALMATKGIRGAPALEGMWHHHQKKGPAQPIPKEGSFPITWCVAN